MRQRGLILKPRPYAFLEIGDKDGRKIAEKLLRSRTVNIGRDKSNQVVLDDPGVSARHCRISYDRKSIQVTDLGSTNGIWVNGQKMESSQVRFGDTI
jgi:pSer/pThr/pTyr-binding forkhead associated (FHA) protein